MSLNAAESSLHSVLFEEGRKLENLKFFPGHEKNLNSHDLCEAASVAIKSAFSRGLKDVVPHTGRDKTTI